MEHGLKRERRIWKGDKMAEGGCLHLLTMPLLSPGLCHLHNYHKRGICSSIVGNSAKPAAPQLKKIQKVLSAGSRRAAGQAEQVDRAGSFSLGDAAPGGVHMPRFCRRCWHSPGHPPRQMTLQRRLEERQPSPEAPDRSSHSRD